MNQENNHNVVVLILRIVSYIVTALIAFFSGSSM